MEYIQKYYKTRPRGPKPRGRASDPNTWSTGPDPIEHDKYYAYIKHRAQAKFRGESYNLTFEDWQAFWPNCDWFERGKGADNLCLSRLDWTQGWTVDNCSVITRRAHLVANKTKSKR